MAQLLVLFFFGLLGLSLRYWIKGEFDPGQLYLLLMFPLAAFVFYFIERWQRKKDREY